MPSTLRALPLLLAAALLAVPSAKVPGAMAASVVAAPERVRGTILGSDGSTLSVKLRAGGTVAVHLGEATRVSGVAAAALSDIVPGSYVGTAAVPDGSGLRALEVLVFPPALKGAGEGHTPWDLGAGSTMTNATVAESVAGVDGRTLRLTYNGGEQRVSVPPGTPIVTTAAATRADLTAGAPVFAVGARQADGSVEARFVVVGNHGVAPPM